MCAVTTVLPAQLTTLTWFEVAVEHGFAAHVVFVGDFLSRTVVVLQVGAVDRSDQRFTQVQLIDLIHDTTADNQYITHDSKQVYKHT